MNNEVFSHLNWLAIILAAVSSFILGGLWYSPLLFVKAWMRANGFTDENLKGGNMLRLFGVSFLFSLVMSFNLAMFLAAPGTTASFGALAGFLAGFGWVFMSTGITAMFERRSWIYILINGGYQTLALTLQGFILGLMR